MAQSRQIAATDLELLGFAVVGKSGALTTHTGDLLEFAFATINIPANTVGANGVIRISAFFGMTSSVNTKTLRARLGAPALNGTVVFTSAAYTTVSTVKVEILIMAANATNSQNTQGWAPRGTDTLVTGSANTPSSIDMTAAQSLVLTGQLANTGEAIQLLGYVVEAVQ